MKKTLLLIAAFVLVAVLAVAGTLAYLTATDEAVNVFTMGDVDITLNEVFDTDDGTADNIVKIIPGEENSVQKEVSITNTGDTDAWVWYTITIPAALDTVSVSGSDVNVINFVFTQNQDWIALNKTVNATDETVTYTYLYKDILAADDTTSKGLAEVYLNEDLRVEKDNAGNKTYFIETTEIDHDFTNGYDVDVKAFAIQNNGFATVNDAYAAYQAQAN